MAAPEHTRGQLHRIEGACFLTEAEASARFLPLSDSKSGVHMDSDRPSPAKVAAVENAISQAAFIMEHIERRWPKE